MPMFLGINHLEIPWDIFCRDKKLNSLYASFSVFCFPCVVGSRAVGRMTLGAEGGQGNGEGLPCALPLEKDASGAARKGLLRRLKSLIR